MAVCCRTIGLNVFRTVREVIHRFGGGTRARYTGYGIDDDARGIEVAVPGQGSQGQQGTGGIATRIGYESGLSNGFPKKLGQPIHRFFVQFALNMGNLVPVFIYRQITEAKICP